MAQSFTMAQNFSSSVDKDVDPRTGQFKPTINLGNVSGNYGLGPNFPLVLRYAPDNNVNEGFGIGWSLSIASFNYSNKVLNHSNGSNWAIDGDAPTGGEYKLKYQKLKDFRFLSLQDGYCIWNAHGDAILLGGAKYNLNSSLMCLPSAMITTAGHQISFTYNDDGKIQCVKDGDGAVLVSFSYTSYSATITVFPGKSFTQVYNFNLQYEYLKSITYETSERGKLVWTFETGTNRENIQEVKFGNNSTLLAVTYPTGTRESVVYNIGAQGLRLPGGGFTPSIKSATSDYSAGQKPIRKRYTYDSTNNNYLGYGSGVDYTSATDDALYNCTDNNYTYSVTEEVLDENNNTSFSTRYIYNKYHLLNEELYRNHESNATRRTVNHYDPIIFQGLPHDKLPSWFQNAIQIDVTTSISDEDGQKTSSKTFSKYREYYGSADPYWDGMIKSETYSDNKRVVHEYYKADGTEAGCPKDPYVITNNAAGWPSTYNSAMEVWDISNPTQDVSVARVEFDYTQLAKQVNAHPDFPTQQFLLQSESRLKTAGKYAIQKIIRYCSDNTSKDYTNISSNSINSIITQENSGYKIGDIGSSIVENYQYSYDESSTITPDTILKITKKSGVENTVISEYRCRYRGLVSKIKDSSNNIHTYEYGTTGVTTKEIYSPLVKKYATTVNLTYDTQPVNGDLYNTAKSELTLNNPEKGPTNMLYSGQIHWLDGAGRPIKIEQAALTSGNSDLIYKQISSYEYNYFGEIASIVSMDILPGTDKNVNATATREHLYNEFKSLSGYIYPLFGSNREVSSTFDPKTTTTTITDNSISYHKKKTVDIVNGIIENKVVDENSINDLHSSIYNFSIFGTLDSNSENITGNRPEESSIYNYKFESDHLGRPTKRTAPDGTAIHINYDARFIQPRVTSVLFESANGNIKTLFACEYNERSLLAKRSLFGRDLSYGYYYSYEYDTKIARVTTKTLSDRQTGIAYGYNDMIGGKLAQLRTSDNRIQNFDFDTLGNITETRETYRGSACTFIVRNVDSLGRVTSESYSDGRDPYAEIEIDYSDGNSKVTSYTNANGLKTLNYYDSLMNLVRTENAIMRADFVYDDYNRVASKTTYSMSSWDSNKNSGIIDNSSRHLTTYTYDLRNGDNINITEFNSKNNTTISIDMTYRSDGLLATRTYGPVDPRATRLRSEVFIYDIWKRLSVYTCNGSQLISDSTGRSITKQAYTYDDLNNILSISTTYNTNGSTKNSVKYFTYRNDNPFLLDTVKVDNGNPVQINYDPKFDRALNDDQGRLFTYDSLERIATVTSSGNRTTLIYDGTNCVRRQIGPDFSTRYFFYDGFSLDAEFKTVSGGTKYDVISRIYSEHGYIGQSDATTNKFNAIPLDSLENPIFADLDEKQLSSGVTPFGDSYNASLVAPSYRGEVYNEALGGYFLGRGYRLYNPRICRFNKPDSLAPHTVAGINPYAYSHNDPINHSDPSGHTPQRRTNHKWNVPLALSIGVFGLACAGLTLYPAIGEEMGAALMMKTGLKLGIIGAGVFLGEEAAKNSHSNSDAAHMYLTASLAILGFGAYSAYGEADKKLATEVAEHTEIRRAEKAALSRAGSAAIHPPISTRTASLNSTLTQDIAVGTEIAPEITETSVLGSFDSDYDTIPRTASKRTSVAPICENTQLQLTMGDATEQFTDSASSYSYYSAYNEAPNVLSQHQPDMASLRDGEAKRRHSLPAMHMTDMQGPPAAPPLPAITINHSPASSEHEGPSSKNILSQMDPKFIQDLSELLGSRLT